MKMRRCISILLSILLLVTAASCSKNEPQPTAAPESSPAAPQTDAEPSGQTGSGGFTYENLANENAVSTLVFAYRNVQVLRYERDELVSETYYFDRGGEIVWTRRVIDADLGETYICGDRDTVYFKEDGHLQFSCYLDEDADSGEDYDFEADISALLMDGTVMNIQSAGEDLWRFEIRGAEYAPGAVCRCTATKQTLTVKTIEWDYGDGDTIRIELQHGDDVQVKDFGFSDSFDKPMRKVTCICTLHDASGRPTITTHVFDVPFNAEPLFESTHELNLYLDEGLTKEYVYPGDGEGYTVYATDAMG